MNILDQFMSIISATKEIALATSVNNIPNVRIVNICYDSTKPEILYFTSDRNNQKVKDFDINNHIAFTTIPYQDIVHIRSHNAIVKKSDYTIYDKKDMFIHSIPDYDQIIDAMGELIDVFEIHIKRASITTSLDNPTIIEF